MSYTQNIIHQAECNYINPMLSNAREMLNSCINSEKHNPDYRVEVEGDLCTGKSEPQSEYHNFYGGDTNLSGPEQVVFTQQFSNNQNSMYKNRQIELVKHQANLINYLNNDNTNIQKSYEEYNTDLDKSGSRGPLDKPVIFRESKPVFPTNTLPKVEKDNGDVIEGFIPGDYITDDGPGEKHITGCPDGYILNKNIGVCEQKVLHGRTHIDNSDFTDICHPNNYNGIDNMGHITCSTELDIDGSRLQLSTAITNKNSMNEIIKNYIR
jgi:hypothetical protein